MTSTSRRRRYHLSTMSERSIEMMTLDKEDITTISSDASIAIADDIDNIMIASSSVTTIATTTATTTISSRSSSDSSSSSGSIISSSSSSISSSSSSSKYSFEAKDLPDETIYIFDGTAMLHLSYYR